MSKISKYDSFINELAMNNKSILGYHGSKLVIDDFKFPLFITTSRLRAIWFAVAMQWDDKLGRNIFRSLKGDEEGYLYYLQIDNPVIKKLKGPIDEKLILDGDVKIIKIEKIGVKKSLRNFIPYKIE